MKRFLLLVLLAPMLLGACDDGSPTGPPSDFTAPSAVALASFMALGDEHLGGLAADLKVVAATEAARSADWDRIRPRLANLAPGNVSALLWFALPNGTYWSVQNGAESGNVSQRPYFQRVMAGETVIGDLVMSMATGRGVAMVVTPVKDVDGTVLGAVGGSVFLDELSERITQAMALPSDMIIYSFTAGAIVGLNRDPSLILADAMQLGPEIAGLFTEMLSRNEGIAQYTWNSRLRTVRYARSSVSEWWYAIGQVH